MSADRTDSELSVRSDPGNGAVIASNPADAAAVRAVQSHHAQSATPGGCGGACGCGGGDPADAAPVLDVRAGPHEIRHATVFGAVAAVPAGGSLVLVAPHDPLPLLAQLDDREPGAFTVGYQERGPQTWRLRLTRSR